MGNYEYIKIPLSLLTRIIYLLECWDINGYDPVVVEDYGEIVLALNKKKQSIELRHAYARIINAGDDDARWQARMNYLQRKREIDEFF